MSATLEELWFLWNLLGIFFLSLDDVEVFFLEAVCFSGVVSLVGCSVDVVSLAARLLLGCKVRKARVLCRYLYRMWRTLT